MSDRLFPKVRSEMPDQDPMQEPMQDLQSDNPAPTVMNIDQPFQFYNLSLHEHVYSASPSDPPVIPYLELPDHRSIQSHIPPMTVRFKRHYIEAPGGIDDTGAKTVLVNYINHSLLGQVHNILGPEAYKKRCIQV